MATLDYTQSRVPQKVKVGFRPESLALIGNVGSNRKGRRYKSGSEQAKKKLNSILENYTISDALRRDIIAQAGLIDTLTTMNMANLAASFVYLSNYPDPTPEDFTDEIFDPYIDRLMQNYKDKEGSQNETAIVRYKYKQSLFRYILKIIALRQDREITEDQMTQLGQVIDEDEEETIVEEEIKDEELFGNKPILGEEDYYDEDEEEDI